MIRLLTLDMTELELVVIFAGGSENDMQGDTTQDEKRSEQKDER